MGKSGLRESHWIGWATFWVTALGVLVALFGIIVTEPDILRTDWVRARDDAAPAQASKALQVDEEADSATLEAVVEAHRHPALTPAPEVTCVLLQLHPPPPGSLLASSETGTVPRFFVLMPLLADTADTSQRREALESCREGVPDAMRSLQLPAPHP